MRARSAMLTRRSMLTTVLSTTSVLLAAACAAPNNALFVAYLGTMTIPFVVQSPACAR